MSRTPDDPDAVALRVLILSRIIQLETLAQATSRTFERARACTWLSRTQVAELMEAHLDREGADEPLKACGR